MIDNAKMAAMILRKYGKDISNEERDQIYELSGDVKRLASYVYELGAPFNPREAELLSRVAGNMDENTNFEKDGDLWNDSTLDRYAKYVHNYKYQYNEEALKVNPNENLQTVHEGPTAQEVQKVNTDLVAKDPKSGYLTIKDPDRIALMNMGVIADLAREVKELKHDNTNG